MAHTGHISVNSKNMFPIIKKWLYSDKDIFLREIVSNGCDAIQKLERLRAIGEAPQGETPRITVTINPEAKTLTVEDNGIGMTEEEVEKYITQVAFSGAEEFIEKYKEKTDATTFADANVETDAGASGGIIGHFGLGFYSAFMVSSTVEIDTLSYQEGAKPVHWVSSGEDTYEISQGSRQTRGTTITMNIAPEEEEFLQEARIWEILQKYCAFMPYEIYLNPKTQTRTTKDEEGNEQTELVPPTPVNNTNPLWLKAPKDCTDEEYKAFYRQVFLDYNDPLFWIHLNVDYPFNLKGILYFPRQSSHLQVMPGQVKLFSNQVFVADNIKEIIPEFLLLLKGVIDCPDMPLNVSRSFLQNDGEVAKISAHITKKVSDKLHQIFKTDRAAYENYWNDISAFIKFGCIKDDKFYDRIKDILLLQTIDGSYKTLEEYPKGEEKQIFYVTDENLQSQYIKMVRENGLTAAVLTHAIDPHFISMLEYKDSETRFARIDADLGEALKAGDSTEEEKNAGETIVTAFKAGLGKENVTVTAEKLKTAAPAVVLLSEYARRIQDMSRLYGETFTDTLPEISIVLNIENPIVQKLPQLQGETAQLVSQQIYDLAMMSHKPLTAEEMSAFIERNIKILELLSER